MDRAGRASADYPLQNLPLAAGQAVSEHEQLADMAGRVDVQSGDFFESVPGADVYVLSYILHDWDDESCLRILRAIRNAAAPGARLVIIESVIPSRARARSRLSKRPFGKPDARIIQASGDFSARRCATRISQPRTEPYSGVSEG
jgi:hypothetical protein